jgi:ketosteroid isomerase-like protein
MTASSDDRILRELTERLFAAIKANDVSALDDMLAGDFMLTSPGGPDQERQAFLDAIERASHRVLEIHGDHIGVRILGETAVVSGMQRARVELPNGAIVAGTTAFVDCFYRDGGRWWLRHAVGIDLAAE